MARTSLLERPEAGALRQDAEVSAAAVRGCQDRLQQFLQRYLPCFYREEPRDWAEVVIQGKLSKLERKTSEPIAYLAGHERKPVQHFVGAGAWDGHAVLAELRQHVAEELADADAVWVLDPRGFPKKGAASCGVARQWCGRLGKVANGQVGVFLAYVTADGYAPLDRQLYLPKEWAADRQRRQQGHVPKHVTFQDSWRIGLALIDRSTTGLPFGGVTGDDEFGRASALRAELRQRRLRYVLDVPCHTLIRDLDETPAAGRRRPPWRRVDAWAQSQPASRWHQLTRGAGAKGPKVVRALEAWVQTQDEDGPVGPRERLVVLRTVDREPPTWYTLSNAPAEVPLQRAAEVPGRRHGVAELLQAGKGAVGSGPYEVRSWVGWHHHLTLSLLALGFLIREKRRLGGKNPGAGGAAAARGVRAAVATGPTEPPSDRGRSKSGSTPQRGGPDLSLVPRHGEVPTPPGTA